MTCDQRGSVTPLIIGFALILATLVAVVVDQEFSPEIVYARRRA